MEFGGDWSEQKLAIVERYLKAYLLALKNTPFDLAYIDAFAGEGGHRPRSKDIDHVEDQLGLPAELFEPESTQFIVGSAIRALRLDPAFHRYVFIEKRADSAELLLQRVRAEVAGRKIPVSVINDDANAAIARLTTAWPTRRRAVMFLDPYAMQVEWSSLERIAATKSIDLWFLFPIGPAIRLLKKDGAVPEKWGAKLTSIFGTDTWRALYRTHVTADLFGDTVHVERDDFETVLGWFNDRLASIFAGVARQPKILRNSKGAPLFALSFAVGNPAGKDIALRIATHLLREI